MNKGISRRAQLMQILEAATGARSDLQRLRSALRNVLPTTRRRRPLLTSASQPARKYALAVND